MFKAAGSVRTLGAQNGAIRTTQAGSRLHTAYAASSELMQAMATVCRWCLRLGQTGIQINTAGSLKADIVVKGAVIGQTDGFIALTAGNYSATVRKTGYKDYPLTFTVIDKQTYQTTITLTPIAPIW